MLPLLYRSLAVGQRCLAIRSLMEDAATAEISRSQVWQLIANNVTAADTGEVMTAARVTAILEEEVQRLRDEVDDDDIFSAITSLPRRSSLASPADAKRTLSTS